MWKRCAVPETVDVCISYYGDREKWDPLAERSRLSALAQTVQPYTVYSTYATDGPLGEVRNRCAGRSSADWLIFLDADDELDPGYIEAMLDGHGDIRQPSTLGVVNGVKDDYPVLIPRKQSYMVGNHLVIGSMVRRLSFAAVGGFKDLPVLEDWDLFIRLRLAGEDVGECPDAIYIVHVQEGSRNQDVGLHARIYAQIQATYSLEWFRQFGEM
jgi:GT2 family glycosyltransferase